MKNIEIILITLLLFIPNCSKKHDPGKPGSVLFMMQKVYSTGDFAGAENYYTTGTVDALNKLDSVAPRKEKWKEIPDKKFSKGAQWDVLSEKIEGSKAWVHIKYIDHPVENMKGLEITFLLSKEEGEWKIDMEDDIKKQIELIHKMQRK